jgi:dipeptidyl aminopeptidase/acylaminoacyl peptidase
MRKSCTGFSPALHSDQINTPLFVAHGTKDPIVNPAQSDEIAAAAVRSRHAKVEYLPVKNEGHIFENEESRIAYYKAVEAFLERYLH